MKSNLLKIALFLTMSAPALIATDHESRSRAQTYGPQTLLDNLLEKPQEILALSKKIIADFTAESASIDTLDQLEEAITEKSNYFELLLLDECEIEYGDELCPHSRKGNPAIRKCYEEELSDILATEARKGKLAVFTSFSSGDLFQDLMVLAKTFKQVPTASIQADFIDPKFGSPVRKEALLADYRLKHLQSFLQRNFPQASLTCNTFHSANQYYSQGPLKVTGLGMIDSSEHAFKDFIDLQKKLLSHNEEMISVRSVLFSSEPFTHGTIAIKSERTGGNTIKPLVEITLRKPLTQNTGTTTYVP